MAFSNGSTTTRTTTKPKKRKRRFRFCGELLSRILCICSCCVNLISLRNWFVCTFFLTVIIAAIPIFLVMAVATQYVIGEIITDISVRSIQIVFGKLDSFFNPGEEASAYVAQTIQKQIIDGKYSIGNGNSFSIPANDTKLILRDSLKIFQQPRSFYVGFSDGSFSGWGRDTGNLYKQIGEDSFFFVQANNFSKTACLLDETSEREWCIPKSSADGTTSPHDCPSNPDDVPLFFEYYSEDRDQLQCMGIHNPQGGFISTSRDWWKQSQKMGQFSLTDPYHYKDSDLVGVTATQPIYDTQIFTNLTNTPGYTPKMIAATCVDYSLCSLSVNLKDIKAAGLGYFILLDDNFKLLASNSGSEKYDILGNNLYDATTEVEEGSIRDVAVSVRNWVGKDKESVERAFITNPVMYGVVLHDWLFHRIVVSHKKYFNSLGVIPIIVIPIIDMSMAIAVISMLAACFLGCVFSIALCCSCLISCFCIEIPLRKLTGLINRIKLLKMGGMKPITFLNVFYEYSRIQTELFVLIDYLTEYRKYLPQELLNELDGIIWNSIPEDSFKPSTTGRAPGDEATPTETESKSAASLSESPAVFSPSPGVNQKGAFLNPNNKLPGGIFQNHFFPKKPQSVDIMRLGLAFVETTMLSIRWVNCYWFFNEFELFDWHKVHYEILSVIRFHVRCLDCITEFTENRFSIFFSDAEHTTLCSVMRVYRDLQRDLKANPLLNEYGGGEFIFALSAERMATGTVGTEEIRKKIRFGQCEKLNHCCIKMCQERKVDCVVSDRFYSFLRKIVEFRPVGFARARKLGYDLFVFENYPTIKDEEELKKPGEEFPKSEYTLGFEELTKANFEKAITLFQQYLYRKPKDRLSKEMIKRTARMQKNALNTHQIIEELTVAVE